MHTGKNYTAWETEITQLIADDLEISYSDAAGMVEAQDFFLIQPWGKGMTARETADVILKASEAAD
ncbi:hypothetical protein H8F21_13935 [Pseudomonas sp. P66]|uniref:Uncharacterized protein n=1 Tax=Pseudomonas arcuscaelestis TaxID=2710591 RepID=A0ABS2BYG5_9PSED|nr:hypothetical protein [Pseudomonas arcuscaelestis]MBM5458666.1 hypothetical protein [Pseudomonas arcuscaelestis]